MFPSWRATSTTSSPRAINRLAIDDSLVKTKLDRVAKTLSGGKLDQATLDRLENRYLDLRSSFRPGLTATELSALVLRIDELEREVAEATR